MGKTILLDNGVFMFRAIMAWRAGNKTVPIGYTYLNMIISNLKRIGVDRDDRIIVAVDSSSWRKKYDAEYKANRKIARDKLEDEIPWDKVFADLERVYTQVSEATDWHYIKIKDMEADDIMAVACRYYSDEEVIVVSSDADLQQLTAHKNVKIWSPIVKVKSGKGGYKIVKNPYKIIADKVAKGDVADNIIVKPTDTLEDKEIREMIINLLELPDFVEEPIKERLSRLEEKELNLDKFPYGSLAKRYNQIYDKDKIVTMEDCIKAEERKKKQRAKKAKAKREASKK